MKNLYIENILGQLKYTRYIDTDILYPKIYLVYNIVHRLSIFI